MVKVQSLSDSLAVLHLWWVMSCLSPLSNPSLGREGLSSASGPLGGLIPLASSLPSFTHAHTLRHCSWDWKVQGIVMMRWYSLSNLWYWVGSLVIQSLMPESLPAFNLRFNGRPCEHSMVVRILGLLFSTSKIKHATVGRDVNWITYPLDVVSL